MKAGRFLRMNLPHVAVFHHVFLLIESIEKDLSFITNEVFLTDPTKSHLQVRRPSTHTDTGNSSPQSSFQLHLNPPGLVEDGDISAATCFQELLVDCHRHHLSQSLSPLIGDLPCLYFWSKFYQSNESGVRKRPVSQSQKVSENGYGPKCIRGTQINLLSCCGNWLVKTCLWCYCLFWGAKDPFMRKPQNMNILFNHLAVGQNQRGTCLGMVASLQFCLFPRL